MKRKLNRRFFLVIVLAVCMTLALTAGICYEMFRTQVIPSQITAPNHIRNHQSEL